MSTNEPLTADSRKVKSEIRQKREVREIESIKKTLISHCFFEDGKGATSQRIRADSEAEKHLQATARKETGTSVLQPHGSKFGQQRE